LKRLLLFLGLIIPLCGFTYQINITEDMLTFDKSGDYDIVSINGIMASAYNPGEPSIPQYPIQLALPNGMEIASVDITYSYPITIPGYFNIYPSQVPQIISDPIEEFSFTQPDPTIYSSNSEFPGKLVSSFTSGNMAGFSVATINFSPLQFIPAQHKLVLYTTIDFEVTYKPMSGNKVHPNIRSIIGEERWRDSIKSMVINPEEVGYSGAQLIDTTKTMDTDIYEYLVITDSTLASSFDNFVAWKTKKGYKTKVMNVSDISSTYDGKDTQDKIRKCIIDYFKNHGLIYVALGGKNGMVPYRACYVPVDPYNVPTEMYYGDLDGTWDDNNNNQYGEPEDGQDFFYDVWVGRLPVTSASDVATVIGKTFTYEGCSFASTPNPWDYLNKMCLMAGYLDSNTDGGLTKDYIDENYIGSWWNITKNYARTNNMKTSDCLASLNSGMNVVNHIMHANSTILGTQDGGMTSSQLYNLTNKPKFTSTMYSLGCYAGDLDVDSNCLYYFVAAPNGGGATFTGNTRYGWYSPGNYRMFSADFDIEYFNQLCANDVWITGETTAKHKYAYASTAKTNDYYRYIYYELYLCGDPDIPIYTNDAKSMTVTNEDTIKKGGQYYTVKVSDTDGNLKDALVCLWKETEVYSVGKTDDSGEVKLSINPTTPGSMYLTVTAHNHKPVEKTVTVNDEDTGVKLNSFTAVYSNNGIILTWDITSDVKVDGFNLYRTTAQEKDASPSELSSSPNIIWTKINKDLITGKNPFSYTDRIPNKNINYVYKLEAITENKAETLGETKTEGNQSPSSFALTSVYPNPAYENISVSVAIPINANISVDIYDITGRKISTVASGLYSPGEYTLTSDITGLTNGVYIVKMTSEGFTASKNFVVAK